MDECGYNIWPRRNRGRALRGRPAVLRVQHQRGRNLTLLVAVCEHVGIIHYILKDRGMDRRDTFIGFLTEIFALIGEENEINLRFDNARAHFKYQIHM